MKKENKIFISCKAIEGFTKENLYFIDLISIGLVKEKGGEYTAFSKEINYELTDRKTREEILLPLYISLDLAAVNYIDKTNFFKFSGKTKKQIAKEIEEFVGDSPVFYNYSQGDTVHVLLSSLFENKEPATWDSYTKNVREIMDGYDVKEEDLLKEVTQIVSPFPLEEARWVKDAYTWVKKKISKK